jgi:hypothetical protein
MKAFTIFNIIAQPLLIILIFVFGYLDFDQLSIGSFCLFCVFQIVHFICRILPHYRIEPTLSGSENIMLGYLIILFILVIATAFVIEILLFTGLLFAISGFISAITNYIALHHYYNNIKLQ